MDHHEQHHQHHQKEREEEQRHHKALERAHGKKSPPFHLGWLFGVGAALVLIAILVWSSSSGNAGSALTCGLLNDGLNGAVRAGAGSNGVAAAGIVCAGPALSAY